MVPILFKDASYCSTPAAYLVLYKMYFSFSSVCLENSGFLVQSGKEMSLTGTGADDVCNS